MAQEARTVSVSDLTEFGVAALRKCGVSEGDARTTIDVLVTTDTFGVYTHGVKCLRGYVKRLRAGGLKADAVPRIVSRGAGLGDRRRTVRPRHGHFRVRHEHRDREGENRRHGLRGRAEQLPLRRGRLLRQPRRQGRHDRHGDGQRLSEHGGTRREEGRAGNQSVRLCRAGGQEADPIFLDIASSTVAGGKVRIAQTKNKQVPDTWMVDTDGVPTTDPFLYPHSAFLLPFARSQGLWNRMMIENLAGVLTGTGAMYDLQQLGRSTTLRCPRITARRFWHSTSGRSRRWTPSRAASIN